MEPKGELYAVFLAAPTKETYMSKRVRVTKVFSSEREIVVGVDGSEHSKDAMKWALREAKLREAVLRLICVAPIGSDVDFDWTVDNSMAESQEIVDHALEMAQALAPTVVVRGEVLVGPVAETLVGASEVTDLLVVGAGGRSAFSEFLLGSVSRECAHEGRCPVVIVHELAQPSIQHAPSHIVVDVEKACGTAALDWAIEEAALRSVRVEAVFDRAGPGDDEATGFPPKASEELTSESIKFTASYIQSRADSSPFASRARRASTVKVLSEACEGADLLVISEVDLEGKHERGAGSFLRRCVQLAPCPVVVVGPSTSSIGATQEGK